jgi:hypothetical protein
MRSSSLIFALALCVAAASAAWPSEDPPQPTPDSPSPSASPSSPVSAAPAESASEHSATAPGATAATAANAAAMAKPGSGKDAGTEQQIRELRSRGFKAENRNGTTVWCRTETTMGSRFTTKKCATADDLDMARQRGKDFTSTIQNYGLPKGKP